MKVIKSIKEMQAFVLHHKKQGKSIGLVPTMGYLHEGHLALAEQARKDNDLVIMSIFVNPLQFGPKEDLSTYPRDFNRDHSLAEGKNVDVIFYPAAGEMYPQHPSILMNVNDRTDVLCGESRPGHFDGVALVVSKLFNIAQPDRAYFGRKDAQQIAVIDLMVADYNFPVEIISVDTIREENGLAMSSRNVHLTASEREQAPVLYQSLANARTLISEGEKDSERIIAFIRGEIAEKTDGEIDYIEIYSYPELKTLVELEGRFIIALAVKFSKARLIDNIIITNE
ncbi:pantoate--beta-alanine ligase [Cytobacillus purgationiresistens]|uniref:Pantothenate synthetase n=1 Tax=Cytobacillus purgationiresistens TaxID=863449 RepID=A0ABU0AIJ7_9BACI|nr:pantoate--beta-alanine ligase [Cytobacillus purgationiresistens]MDQ0271052.1 pantoate--beta-alanine ligase [Cytobacillus purgationiresistens]